MRYSVAMPQGKNRWIDIEDAQSPGETDMAVVSISTRLPNAEAIANELCARLNAEAK